MVFKSHIFECIQCGASENKSGGKKAKKSSGDNVGKSEVSCKPWEVRFQSYLMWFGIQKAKLIDITLCSIEKYGCFNKKYEITHQNELTSWFLAQGTQMIELLSQLSPPPHFIDERMRLYSTLKAEHDALMAKRALDDSQPIKVTLPDGNVVDAESWKTTPYQVACGIRWVWS